MPSTFGFPTGGTGGPTQSTGQFPGSPTFPTGPSASPSTGTGTGASGGLPSGFMDDPIGWVIDHAGDALGQAFMTNGKIDLGKIFAAAGGAASSYNAQANTAAQLALTQFGLDTNRRAQEANTVNTLGGSMVGVEDRINAAPMRERANAMLMQRIGAPPPAFRPRDYTQGFGDIAAGRGPSGGAAPAIDAASAAAAAWKPTGTGYGDTSVQRALLQRLGGLAGVSTPGAPVTPVSSTPATPAAPSNPATVTPPVTASSPRPTFLPRGRSDSLDNALPGTSDSRYGFGSVDEYGNPVPWDGRGSSSNRAY